MIENDYSLDDMYSVVIVDIRGLGVGKISKDTIKNFYHDCLPLDR